MLRTPLFLAALALAGTASAQTQPSAVRANNQAAQADAARQASTDATRLQYSADLAAYDRALMRHDRRADRQAMHYRHQQRAYADAMSAWRAQDYACRHGSRRACNTPAPNPAAFW